MISKRTVSVLATTALLGLAACGGTADDDAVMTDTTTTIVPGMDTVPAVVEVPAPDTIAVETEVEMDVDRDTVIDTRP